MNLSLKVFPLKYIQHFVNSHLSFISALWRYFRSLITSPFIFPLFWFFQPSLFFSSCCSRCWRTERILDHLSCTCMWVYMKNVRGQLSARLLCLHGVFYFTLDFAGTPNTSFTYWWETGTSLSISDTYTPYTHTHTALSRRDVLKTQIAFIAYICFDTVYKMEDNIIVCPNLTGPFSYEK